MFGFAIKKSFYDLWDNMFAIGLLNLGFILSLALPLLLPAFVDAGTVGTLALCAAAVAWCCVYLATSLRVVHPVSDHGSIDLKAFPAALASSWKRGLALALVLIAWLVTASLVLPFYAGMGNLFGLFAGALAFWILVTLALALQFFLSASVRLPGGAFKILKKCFLLFMDNPLFSLLAAMVGAVLLALSLLLALLFPGPVGVLLFLDEALRLRLKKYDYLEAQPDADRRRIPWAELLEEDRELVGTRSLRSFIFPWKD